MDEATQSQTLPRDKAAPPASDRRAVRLTVSASRWMRPEQQPNSSSRSRCCPDSTGIPRASPLLSLTAISGTTASPDTASDGSRPAYWRANRPTVGADLSAFPAGPKK